MATWPAKTWKTGEFVTTQMMNDVRDQLNELHSMLAPDLAIWTDVPFSAGNFFYPSGSAWTVAPANVKVNRYFQLGKLITWSFYATGTQVTGAAVSYVYMRVPVPVARGYYNCRVVRGINSVPSVYGNNWMWIDPASGCLLFQAGSTIPAGSLDLEFTVNYEAA